MTNTPRHVARRCGSAAAVALAAAGVFLSTSEIGSSAESVAERVTLRTPSTQRDAAPRPAPGPYRYRWPVKPFDRQHPVRGFFGDPRIANHGQSKQFHFGVDISAPNGTPVFATLTGRVSIHPLHATTVLIVDESGLEFSYWHVAPTVRSGQRAIAYKTVIGRIEAPYGHVHFSERRNGRYLNPLRRGAMGPFVDATRPGVTAVRAEVGGWQSAEAHGEFDLVAAVRDETPLAVPRPWHDLPVMPALIRWRVLDARDHVLSGWRTAADFRETIPPASEFDSFWALGTTQNHVRAPGRYRLYLARGWKTRQLRKGSYIVEVAVADTRGNAARIRFPLTVS
jgi:murein DD-endopeptidase MepM/ murein hydrolase activator NlpD